MPPLFSIIIPTRDRASLLPAAIRSALAQTCRDFELIISDNSETDQTRDVLAEFDDPRIHYRRTPTSLLMPQSWTFAASLASGSYLLFLCDDDALHPRLLEVLTSLIDRAPADLFYWRACAYSATNWQHAEPDARFSFGPPYTDLAFHVDPHALLDTLFDMRITPNSYLPRMLNAAVHRRLFTAAAAAKISPFRPASPDFTAMTAWCALATSMIFLDAPLMAAGDSPHSIGSSALKRGRIAQRYLAEMRAAEPNLAIPPLAVSPTCWLAQAFLQASREFPLLRNRPVNWPNTFAAAHAELQHWAAQGHDVTDLLIDFAAAMTQLPASDQQTVHHLLADNTSFYSEAFLRDPIDSRYLLSVGPVLAPSAPAAANHVFTIDALAASIDDWLTHHAAPLTDLWNRVNRLAQNRNVCIYGLGQNGRALLRIPLPANHALRNRLFCCDDRPSEPTPPFAPRLENPPLHPHETFVLITPTHHTSISRALLHKNFQPSRDFLPLTDFFTAAAAASSSH